ncbi:hypothetical protein ACN267_31230 [Micromonospora sp. WMMD734]|uniref:hypothetical protein n=1 Tax=Micromonospora sp. WMMD734 TaxID=3404129 RepID=UPI003B94E405
MTAPTLTRPAGCTAPTTGLAGYKVHRCRCVGCTQASTDYQNRRARLLAYGQWQPMVDAEPIRQHVRNLGTAGIGWMRVAELAGISHGAVSRLLYGSTNRPPCKRVRRETADALLAVTANPDNLAPGQTVDATGTRRRTQALAAIGWSVSEQARRIGRTCRNHCHVLTIPAVQLRTAEAVKALYDELSTTPAPPGVSATRTKRWAQRHGWVPPLAWDDDTIDDPAASPDLGDERPGLIDPVAVERALAGERVRLTDAERDEAFRIGLARGMSGHAISVALRLSSVTYRRIVARITATQAA